MLQEKKPRQRKRKQKVCRNCEGTGEVVIPRGYTALTFVVPTEMEVLIKAELKRIDGLLETQTDKEVVRRGVALCYMAVLSAQTPTESLI